MPEGPGALAAPTGALRRAARLTTHSGAKNRVTP
jgi:hypothetical protein